MHHYGLTPLASCLRAVCVLIVVFLVCVQSSSNARDDQIYPSPRCCKNHDCLTRPQQGKNAFLVSVRSAGYWKMFLELHCSLQKTNPGVELIVLGAEGDLPPATVNAIDALNNTRYLTVPDFQFVNTQNPRFAFNWIKLRAWELTMYDAIIMLDADAVVLGDLTHLFSLPTDFAWTILQGPNFPFNAGGVVFLRPCKPVFNHMQQLLTAHRELRYERDLAEQSFLLWYWGYQGIRLPMIYNANQKFVKTAKDGHVFMLGSGASPLVMHFADIKPFTPTPNTPDWPYLCHAPKTPQLYASVTFYDHCYASQGYYGQYITYGVSAEQPHVQVTAEQLREYRMFEKISLITQLSNQTVVKLFNNDNCTDPPMLTFSNSTVCLTGQHASVNDKTRCLRVELHIDNS